MIPVELDPSALKVGLVGRGKSLTTRLRFLGRSGVRNMRIFSDDPGEEIPEPMRKKIANRLPEKSDLRGLDVLYISGLKPEEYEPLAKIARRRKILVNCEDVKELCDFYMPAVVRRGDLVVTISTSGVSPGLAKRLRKYLSEVFGLEWKQRLEEIGNAREIWKQNGADMKDVNRMTNAMIDENDWLP